MARGIRTYYFADADDQKRFVAELASTGGLRFTYGVWREPATEPSYLDPRQIPNVGYVRANFDSITTGYCVTLETDKLIPRALSLPGVPTRYEAGPNNPDSVRVSLGGEAGNMILVCSLIHTLGSTARSRELHSRLTKAAKKLSVVKCDRFLMFPGAITKLELGWRLAEGALRPTAADFTLEQYRICLDTIRKKGKAKAVSLGDKPRPSKSKL
jgi:hypothetical protein